MKHYKFNLNQHESSVLLNALNNTIQKLKSYNTGIPTDDVVQFNRMVDLHKHPIHRKMNEDIIEEYEKLFNKLIQY